MVAEDIRRAIHGLGLAHPGSPLGVVTISIGVTSITPKRSTGMVEQFIAAADDALYKAKREGRNRVQIARVELLS